MKSKKLLFPALALCSILFASCSMNKNNMSSASLETNKMQNAQQLDQQKVAINTSSVDAYISPEINLNGKEANLSATGLKQVQIPIFLKYKKSNLTANTARTFFHNPVLMASTAANEIQKFRNAGTHTAAHKDLPFAGSNLLVMWIVFLLASILLYIIAGLFVAASLPGVLFTILGFIAGLIFLYFLILWLIQLYKASKK